MLSVLFSDDMSGTIMSSANWQNPVWSSDGSTFVGQTQFICQPAPLPACSNSDAKITVQSYNPTATAPNYSFYGYDVISNPSFSPGTEGIDITFRAEGMSATTPGLVGGLYLYALVPGSQTIRNEIDFELLTNNPNEFETNIFTNQPTTVAGLPQYLSYPSGASASVNQWHTYQIQWLPNEVNWLVNGTLVWTDSSNIPSDAMNVNLDMWVPSSSWPQAYNPNLHPATSAADNTVYPPMLVDWVYVSTHQTATSIVVSPATAAVSAGRPSSSQRRLSTRTAIR